MTLKVYGTAGSSNVQKVMWCCAEAGCAFERIDTTEVFGGVKAPAFLALNPNGLMPVLDDGGFVLWESNVIVRYLAAKYAAGTLWPTDARARADADRWMDWQQTSLASHMAPIFRALLRTPRVELPPEVLADEIAQCGKAWGLLDDWLAGREYVGGASLTMGDIALGNAIHRWYRFPIERPDHRHLRAWYDRLRERPGYRQHIS